MSISNPRNPSWPPCRLPLLWLRIIVDNLAGWGRSEVANAALHPVALTSDVDRGHFVVVGGLRLQMLQAHAENRLWMRSVEPDVASGCPAQILGIRSVMHDAIMLVVTARIGGGPADDRHPGVGRFELRRLGDLDVLGPFLRRKELSSDRVGEEQATGRAGNREFCEQAIH